MNLYEYLGTHDGSAQLKKNGLTITLYHFAEECAELLVEIIHDMRTGERGSHPEKIQEEICDVLILIDDLWDDFRYSVRKHYDDLAMCYVEGRKILTEKVLESLVRCQEAVCCYNYIGKRSDDVAYTIGVLILYLEEYVEYYSDGFDATYQSKCEKRRRYINGEKSD